MSVRLGRTRGYTVALKRTPPFSRYAKLSYLREYVKTYWIFMFLDVLQPRLRLFV